MVCHPRPRHRHPLRVQRKSSYACLVYFKVHCWMKGLSRSCVYLRKSQGEEFDSDVDALTTGASIVTILDVDEGDNENTTKQPS
jgi:hypothetical protein